MFMFDFKSLEQIFLLAILFYFTLILFLRISGKRTLSDLNAFDMIVSISIGSILSTTILASSTQYLEGSIAIGTLIGLQYIVAKLSIKSKIFKRIIKSKPVVVFYEGEFLNKNMDRQRLTKDDILEQIRIKKGVTSDKVKAVVLETNGKLSVITDITEDFKDEITRYI